MAVPDRYLACPGCPLPLDDSLWAALLALWVITNVYFSQFFLGREASDENAMKVKRMRALNRRSQHTLFNNPQESTWQPKESTWQLAARLVCQCAKALPTAALLCCKACGRAFFSSFFRNGKRQGCLPMFSTIIGLFLRRVITTLIWFPFVLVDTVLCCGHGGKCGTNCCRRLTGLTCMQFVSMQLAPGPCKRYLCRKKGSKIELTATPSGSSPSLVAANPVSP